MRGRASYLESRPLHSAQRKNVEASFNVCLGPIPEVDARLPCECVAEAVDASEVTTGVMERAHRYVLSLKQRAR
jgi:hypothetical protein